MTMMEMVNLTIEFIKRMVIVNLPGFLVVLAIVILVRVVTKDKAIWRKVFDWIGNL